MTIQLTPIFKNRRITSVMLLGFASGLPLSLTSSTLQAWFTQAGIDLVTIGSLSLIGLLYGLKFLWSPIMDRYVPPLLGRRRGWILVTQLCLCVALIVLGNMNPVSQSNAMEWMALIIVFFSASQDIAFDAYRTDILSPDERGVGVAAYIFAYRIATLVSGGMALVLADYWGWHITYNIMAAMMAATMLITWWSPEAEQLPPPKNFIAAIAEPFKDLFARNAIGMILLFLVFYKFGDALSSALMTNFLLGDLGFSLTQVGFASKTVGLVATISGAFAGGMWLTRLGLFRSLLWFGVLQSMSNLSFVLLAYAGKSTGLMMLTIFADSFCGGMSTAAFVAFIMSLCNHRYSATQFACLSALPAIARGVSGPLAGMMVQYLGWISFFGWAFVFCFPGLILLTLIRSRVGLHVETAQA